MILHCQKYLIYFMGVNNGIIWDLGDLFKVLHVFQGYSQTEVKISLTAKMKTLQKQKSKKLQIPPLLLKAMKST